MSTALRTRLLNGAEVKVCRFERERGGFVRFEVLAYGVVTDDFEEARAVHDAIVRVLKERELIRQQGHENEQDRADRAEALERAKEQDDGHS